MAETIHSRATRADVRRAIVGLVEALTGRVPDPSKLAEPIQLRVGVTLLSLIQQAFIAKARGGTGSDGITWPPLTRATIAQRRTSSSERKELGISGKRTRGLLTPAEDKRWRSIFGTRLARLRAQGVPEDEAKATAARIAWSTLKSEGAKTKLDVLGGRKVDILRDTGELFRSLSPGVDDRPSGAPGQIFRTQPGAVVVGTNVKPWHHRGIPGKLPRRALWPDRLPPAWWQAIRLATARGLLAAARQAIMARGRGG